MRWSKRWSEKSANLFSNKGQSGDGGKIFNDKIPLKGFREGVKNVSLGTSPTWGCGVTS